MTFKPLPCSPDRIYLARVKDCHGIGTGWYVSLDNEHWIAWGRFKPTWRDRDQIMLNVAACMNRATRLTPLIDMRSMLHQRPEFSILTEKS